MVSLQRMVFALLIVAVAAALAGAEQSICKTGENYCKGYQSLSIINNNFFCCETGFIMQWKNEVTNDTTISTCVCNRHYYETDCIEGQRQCQGANSLLSDGTTIKCCKGNESMNSVRNSIVNGVVVDYCKCVRYVNGAGGGFVNMGGIMRPMTDAERTQFANSMTQFSNDMQTNAAQLGNSIMQSMGMFGLGSDPFSRRQVRPQGGGFHNWAANFLEGLGQSFRRIIEPVVVPQPGEAANNDTAAQIPTAPRTIPKWEARQRRFQELQRRLQQRRELAGRDLNYYNRRSQTRGTAPFVNFLGTA